MTVILGVVYKVTTQVFGAPEPPQAFGQGFTQLPLSPPPAPSSQVAVMCAMPFRAAQNLLQILTCPPIFNLSALQKHLSCPKTSVSKSSKIIVTRQYPSEAFVNCPSSKLSEHKISGRKTKRSEARMQNRIQFKRAKWPRPSAPCCANIHCLGV